MFFMRENETLYLTTYHYNIALILEELKKLILDNGGKVKEQTPGHIVNRSFFEAAEEETRRADGIRHYIEIRKPDEEKTAELEARIKELEASAEALKQKAEESTRPAASLSYICFALDGFYYYIQKADIEYKLQFSKTAINARGEYSRDAYLGDLENDWMQEDFYRLYPENPEIDTERREAAKAIYTALITAGASQKYREGRKTRVANTYNSGYHYETVYRPERMSKIDF